LEFFYIGFVLSLNSKVHSVLGYFNYRLDDHGDKQTQYDPVIEK